MKNIFFLVLFISFAAFGQRNGIIDADTTTRPKSGLSALAFNAGVLKVVRNTGNSYQVVTSNNTYTNPAWLNLTTFGRLASANSWTGNNTFGGSASPTHAVTLPSGASLTSYNTADQTTNFERVRGFWSSNTYNLFTEAAGSATVRDLILGNNTTQLQVSSGGSFKILTSFGVTGIGSPFQNQGTLSASSGVQNAISYIPTINQGGTAGYRGLFVSPYEQTTGSGSKLLIDLGTNSAANGSGTHTSRFNVDNLGNISFPTSATTNGQVTITFNSGVANGSYIRSYSHLHSTRPNHLEIGTYDSSPIRFHTNSAESGRIFGDGNWFIGSSPVNAGHKLYINGTAAVSGNLTVTNIEASSDGAGDIGTSSKVFANIRSVDVRSEKIIERYSGAGLTFQTNSSIRIAYMFPTTGNFHFQNGGTYTDIPSARLAINSTTQGFLPPRMSQAQRNAIASPVTGLTLYCTDCTATDSSTGVMQTYNGSVWKNNW